MENVLKEILLQIQCMSDKLQYLSSKQTEANRVLARLEVKLENTTDAKIKALFEYRDIVRTNLEAMNNELADLKEHISDHEISLKVIKNRTKVI